MPVGSGSTVTATALQRKAMGLLVPLYGYPLVSLGSGSNLVTQTNPAWTTVAEGAASVPTVAIINPSNGPVSCTNPPSVTLLAFRNGIALLHASGG